MQHTSFDLLPAGTLASEDPFALMKAMEDMRGDLSDCYSGYNTIAWADALIDGFPSIIIGGNLKPYPNSHYDDPANIVRVCSEFRICMVIEDLREKGHQIQVRHLLLNAPFSPQKDQIIVEQPRLGIRTPCGDCLAKISETPEIDPDRSFITSFTQPKADGQPNAILTVRTSVLLQEWKKRGCYRHPKHI